MIPIGYMLRRPLHRPEWLAVPHVEIAYSVGYCTGGTFAGDDNIWAVNAANLYDTPEVLLEEAREIGADLEGCTLFYYERSDLLFDQESGEPLTPELARWLETPRVRPPPAKQLAGYDVVAFNEGQGDLHSPLFCNSRATEIAVDEHCLLRDPSEAEALIRAGRFRECEPGDYGVVAVYRV